MDDVGLEAGRGTRHALHVASESELFVSQQAHFQPAKDVLDKGANGMTAGDDLASESRDCSSGLVSRDEKVGRGAESFSTVGGLSEVGTTDRPNENPPVGGKLPNVKEEDVGFVALPSLDSREEGSPSLLDGLGTIHTVHVASASVLLASQQAHFQPFGVEF